MVDYDADYFERGIMSGKSCYTDYRWIPELTLPLAMSYIDVLNIRRDETVLDYGCAKGFMVKALRMLHRQAWGCDISQYAIDSADEDTAQHLMLSSEKDLVPFGKFFDYILSKDVFEHVEYDNINRTLAILSTYGKILFATIPLGNGERYNVPAYELDVTHKIRESKDWWIKKLEGNGWRVSRFDYLIAGIKDNWGHYPQGNGFFICERR